MLHPIRRVYHCFLSVSGSKHMGSDAASCSVAPHQTPDVPAADRAQQCCGQGHPLTLQAVHILCRNRKLIPAR